MKESRKSGVQLRWINAFFLTAVMLGTGCKGHICDSGDSNCDGRVVRVCVEDECHFGACGSDTDWETTVCDNTCVQPTGGAPFCTLSTAPDPRCEARDRYCDGDATVWCFAGFATQREDCRVGLSCVESEDGVPFCVLPDPKCASRASYCDTDSIVHCLPGHAVGYTIEHVACPIGSTCTQVGQEEPACAVDPMSDTDAGTRAPSP